MATLDNKVIPPGGGGGGTVNQGTGGVSPWLVGIDQTGDNNDVDVISSVLPTGAATDTLQTSGNASLTSIDGKTPALGQAAKVGSTPVTIASDQGSIDTNLKTLDSKTIDRKGGTIGDGTQRVVLATDQPQLTNKLLVTPDANSQVDLNKISGQNVLTGGLIGQLSVGGGAAQGAAPTLSGNPLLIAGNDYGGVPKTQWLKVDSSGGIYANIVTNPVQVTGSLTAAITAAAGDLGDGSLVTLGAKADNKSAATDTTPVTAMQVLKEISYMEQNPASRAVTAALGAFASGAIADGAMVTIGAKADAKSPATDTTAITIMQVLKQISASVQSPPYYAPSNVSSTVYETNHVIKASAGTLFSITGYNSRTSAQFIQLHDATSLPADTAVPKLIFAVGPSSSFSLDFGPRGRSFGTGIVVCNSSTGPTKTIGSADCWFDCQFS